MAQKPSHFIERNERHHSSVSSAAQVGTMSRCHSNRMHEKIGGKPFGLMNLQNLGVNTQGIFITSRGKLNCAIILRESNSSFLESFCLSTNACSNNRHGD